MAKRHRRTNAQIFVDNLPEEGTIGNKSLRARLRWSEATYEKIKWQLLDDGEIALGRGKDGSVSRAVGPSRKRGKLKISRSKGPVMRIESAAFEAQGIVYVLVANRQIKYRKWRSSIVYIGTSCGGASRVAASMVERAATAFAKRGVSTVYAQVLTSSGKQGVRTWKELEAAAIETFEQTRGELPLCNKRNERSSKSEEEIYRHNDFAVPPLNSTLHRMVVPSTHTFRDTHRKRTPGGTPVF